MIYIYIYIYIEREREREREKERDAINNTPSHLRATISPETVNLLSRKWKYSTRGCMN